MTEFEVRGADAFFKLSKALKAAGKTELRKELHAGMRQAAKPLIPKARASARTHLPQRGGLAKAVSKSPIRVQVRTGRNTYGVRIAVGNNRSGARGANQGVIRHPVFGDREHWETQSVPPGWFDDVMEASAPQVRPEVEKAMQRVIDTIVREAR